MKAILVAMLSMLTCCSKPPPPPDALPHYEMLPSYDVRHVEAAPRPERKPTDIDGDIADALNRAELAAQEAHEMLNPKDTP